MTDIGEDFEILRAVKGQVYRKRRDALLSSVNAEGLCSRLAPYLENDRWLDRVMSRIVIGWSQNTANYEAINADLNRVDIRAASRSVSGVAGVWRDFSYLANKRYGRSILPLCWEALLKFQLELPVWKIFAFLSVLEAMPDPLSVGPVANFMDSSAAYELQDAAAQVMIALPKDDVKPWVDQLYAKHCTLTAVLQKLRVSI